MLRLHTIESNIFNVTETGELNEDDSDPDQPVFSLVTGTYRHAKRFGGGVSFLSTQIPSLTFLPVPGNLHPESQNSDDTPTAVILRNQDTALATLADSAGGAILFCHVTLELM